jgi:hypothetical protein
VKREVANAVYDILVRLASAPERMRENFLRVQESTDCREYRFMGSLGFGGKFWKESWRVSCYPEDETPDRAATIRACNAALQDLRDRSVSFT